LELLCTHHRNVGRKPLFNKEQYEFISQKLNDPLNGLRGYKDLTILLESTFKQAFKYNTVLKFCIRNFKSKIKVARKSHIKKDKNAVETFKKNSVKSAKKP